MSNGDTRARLRAALEEILIRIEEHPDRASLPDIQGCALLAHRMLARLRGGQAVDAPIAFVTCRRDLSPREQEVQALARSGNLPIQEVADRSGVHTSYVRDLLSQEGIPRLIAIQHPEYSYVFLVRVEDPLGSPRELVIGALADGSEDDPRPLRPVAIDCSEARAAIIDAAGKWVRFVDRMLVQSPERPSREPDLARAKEERGGPKLKEPPEIAFEAYGLWRLAGLTQEAAAEKLQTEKEVPVSQPQVSRWCGEVRDWIGAGNPLPDGTAPRARTHTMDPTRIDLGERRDHRAKRQIEKYDPEDD